MTEPRADAADSADTAAEECAPVIGGLPTVGQTIGPYRLLSVLGKGGFSVVYLAEQREPFRRKVALKINKLGMDTQEFVSRFKAERQALAMMDHPNIARVFDAGATGTGRPFFVMEVVDGEPIVRYCDRHTVPLKNRIALFVSVCRAIDHAHSKGIVHRDIKPSNVLVANRDGHPTAKVIDFGVAKAMGQALTDRTFFTSHGVLVGTAAYMSPEQANMLPQTVDARSDVYSLGVVLYELLAGALPFNPEAFRDAGIMELQRIITKVPPPRPSTRLSSDHAALAATARARSCSVDTLRRSLRGDLDRVILKALEKEPERRYQKASELADDLDRHLAGRPVRAHPPSMLYRASRLVRRRRSECVTVAVAIFAVCGMLAGSLWQRDRPPPNARDAEPTAAGTTRAPGRHRRESTARGQYDVTVLLSKPMANAADTMAPVEVHILALDTIEGLALQKMPMSRYWDPGRPPDNYARHTMQFGEGRPTSYVLNGSDPIWHEWGRAGASYLFVLADLPTAYNDAVHTTDPRRVILPLDEKHWPKTGIAVKVTQAGIHCITPRLER
jgi:eukaryotic-like serine/threonine-protein kinase